jgi:hypothetical protein
MQVVAPSPVPHTTALPDLATLEAEQRALPTQLAAAAEAADAVALLALRYRRDELTTLVEAARITAARERIGRLERLREEARAALPAATKAAEKAAEDFIAARDAYDLATRVQRNAADAGARLVAQANGYTVDIAEARRELAALVKKAGGTE